MLADHGWWEGLAGWRTYRNFLKISQHSASVPFSRAFGSIANSGLALGRSYANIKMPSWVHVSLEKLAFLGRLHNIAHNAHWHVMQSLHNKETEIQYMKRVGQWQPNYGKRARWCWISTSQEMRQTLSELLQLLMNTMSSYSCARLKVRLEFSFKFCNWVDWWSVFPQHK